MAELEFQKLRQLLMNLAENAQALSAELARVEALGLPPTTKIPIPPPQRPQLTNIATRDEYYRQTLNAFAAELRKANPDCQPLDPQMVRDFLTQFSRTKSVNQDCSRQQAAARVLAISPHVPSTQAIATICGLRAETYMTVAEARRLAGGVDEKTIKTWFRMYEIGGRSPSGNRRIYKQSLQNFLNLPKRERWKMARQVVENS